MRVSLQWLRELVPFRSDVNSLAEQLSMAGFEVEEQEDLERLLVQLLEEVAQQNLN